MHFSKIPVLGINITTEDEDTILKLLLQNFTPFAGKLLSDTKAQNQHSSDDHASQLVPLTLSIFTPNPEQIIYATTHPWYKKLLNSAYIAIPDGVGDTWAIRVLYSQSVKRIAGIQLVEKLIDIASKEDLCIAYLGGKENSATTAFEKIRIDYPTAKGWAETLPKFAVVDDHLVIEKGNDTLEQYIKNLVSKIIDKKTDIVFVALGAPKQELFISELKKSLEVGVWSLDKKNPISRPVILMSVGGSFEEIAGVLKKPPAFISNLGLKWLWRLSLEPWRWRRQLAIPQFIFLVYLQKLDLKKFDVV